MSTSPSHYLDLGSEAVVAAKHELRVWFGRSAADTFSDESASGIRATMDQLAEALSAIPTDALDTAHFDRLRSRIAEDLGPWLDTSDLIHEMSSRDDGVCPSAQGFDADAEQRRPEQVLNAWVGTLPSVQADAEAVRLAVKEGLSRPGRTVLFGADHPAIQGLDSGDAERVSWSPGADLTLPSAPDTVVLPGLLAVLPDRVLVALLKDLRAHLPADGICIASGLLPSVDQSFADLVLGWPTVRRSPAQLMNLLMLAGFQVKDDVPCTRPGIVVVAAPSSGAEHG